MAQRRKSAEDRKAEIVRAAVRLAAEIGPDRVTTQALADAVGLSQAAVFRHFPTKPLIWLAVGETIARRMQADQIDDGSPDPAGRLNDLVIRYLGQIAQTPAIPAILFSRELHAENEPLRAHFEQVMALRRAGFARLVACAVAAGQFAPGTDPDDTAALILATLQGLAMRWSLENRRFDLQAEGTRLLAALTGGLSQVRARQDRPPAP